jgi:DinB superfamily
MSSDDAFREHLLNHLRGAVQRRFEQTVADFPPQFMNARPPNVGYSPWELLEHLRLSQWDLLEYVRNPAYKAPSWPEGYWPASGDETDPAGWNASVEQFRKDAEDFIALVGDPATDLTAQMPNTPGHTVLREAMLDAGHSSYHLGEFGILREVMQSWPPGHK